MMDTSQTPPIVTIAEAQAFARIESGEEEALIAGMVRSASALCESFIGQAVIARTFTEAFMASSDWQRLSAIPVRSIDDVGSDGSPLPASTYATDIDSSGYGWVRVTDPAISGRIEVTGTAGLALSTNGVPEPIRHGVLRLVAHFYSDRDGAGGEIPAAVSALWRPFRRIRIA